ncbi:hypothetical protein EW146_g6183 [Bondarzewia mesenterica]|uniref:RecA family profile 1 domain-containing protein n=1 Tax=Bondarzewia mesenterica TaxID=1095465 RepID=A0A4S4LR76_9AGAM|nr:hypothetical protein EW146_g6183 [Bondarzewia mesenterica]
MSIRLSNLSPALPPALLQNLSAINIKTAADLVFIPPDALLHSLPRGSTTLGELESCIDNVTGQVAAEGMSGDELLASEVASDLTEVKSGVSELDELIGGSFSGTHGGNVIEISGKSGTGKTALALHTVLSHLSQHGRDAAIWMDTTGDLSAQRLTHAMSSQAGPCTDTALERLHISLAFEIEAAYDILDNIRSVLTSTSSSDARPRILVIDTITPLLGPNLSATSSQGHAAMTTFMRSLRTLARTHALFILVLNSSTVSNTNSASAFAWTTHKPALGPSFTFLTDATLWLARPPPSALNPTSSAADDHDGDSDRDQQELRIAEVLRSRISVCSFIATVSIRSAE